MPLDLLYFGALRDTLGRDVEVIDPPSHVLTVDDLIGWLAARGGAYGEALRNKDRVAAAIDREYASAGDSFFGAREVALFPPVTGL